MKKGVVLSMIALCFAVAAVAADGPVDRSKLSNELIYSVNRTPERPFETARAVEVITAEDIWRSNAMSLSDILLEAPGFLKYRTTQASVTGVVRGLVGRQVLILIDGVKVNDTLSGDVPNFDLIDVSQVERIEIVRGVVSVLGTESLGGVINIITKRAPGDGQAVGGTIGARFSSAAKASPNRSHPRSISITKRRVPGTAAMRRAGPSPEPTGILRGTESPGSSHSMALSPTIAAGTPPMVASPRTGPE